MSSYNSVKQFEQFLENITLYGVTGGVPAQIAKAAGVGLVVTDAMQFIHAQTAANLKAFNTQLGSTIAGEIGSIVFDSLVVAAGISTGGAEGPAIIGFGSFFFSVAGKELTQLTQHDLIPAVNTVFNEVNNVVKAVGTFESSISAGESPQQAVRALIQHL